MPKPAEVVEKFQSVTSIACESLVRCAKEQPCTTLADVKAVMNFLAIVDSLTKETREALDACFKAQEVLKAKIQQQTSETWEDL